MDLEKVPCVGAAIERALWLTFSRFWVALPLLGALGCSGANASSPPAQGPQAGEPRSSAPSAGELAAAANEPAQPGSALGAEPPAPALPAGAVSPPPPAGTPSLPALSVHSVGMHVGGGPNDKLGKAPFENAIERRFPDFLRCYRLVDAPEKGGTFGVDLRIERGGGHPSVSQPRSALGGDDFRACMITAFESIEFPKLKKPSVVSYSLRFKVEP